MPVVLKKINPEAGKIIELYKEPQVIKIQLVINKMNSNSMIYYNRSRRFIRLNECLHF